MSKTVNRKVFSVSLGGIMIKTENLVELYFMEDITRPMMNGFLSFYDRTGLMELKPITGNEVVAIKYGDVDDDDGIDISFLIFSINKVTPLAQFSGSNDTLIEMLLVDPLFHMLTVQKYSTSWPEGTLLSDIIKDLCSNVLDYGTDSTTAGNIWDWEDSIEKIGTGEGTIPSFYMPYWNILETINWLMRRCSGSISGLPGYVFYNSPKGLSFVTLENLMVNEKIEKNEEGKTLTYRFTSDDVEDDCKILSWSLHPVDKQSFVGLLGGHKMGYDHNNKMLMDAQYDYEEVIKNYTLLGNKTFFTENYNVDARVDMEGDNDYNILENIGRHDFIRRYISQMAMVITVRGAERRYAGGIIDIMWPSVQKGDTNKNLQGYWMIKAITHHFSGTGPYYQQKMTLMKTAYSDSDVKVLMKSGKNRVVRGI